MKKESLKTQCTEAGLCAIGLKVCNAIKSFGFFLLEDLAFKKKKKKEIAIAVLMTVSR